MGKPIGEASAAVTARNKDGEEVKKYVKIGQVWRTKSDNLLIALEAEPLAWKDPHQERVILLTFEKPPIFGDEY